MIGDIGRDTASEKQQGQHRIKRVGKINGHADKSASQGGNTELEGSPVTQAEYYHDRTGCE